MEMYHGCNLHRRTITGELVGLTGKKYHTTQLKELNALGIMFRTRSDGSVVVARADIPMDKPKSKKATEFVINA